MSTREGRGEKRHFEKRSGGASISQVSPEVRRRTLSISRGFSSLSRFTGSIFEADNAEDACEWYFHLNEDMWTAPIEM